MLPFIEWEIECLMGKVEACASKVEQNAEKVEFFVANVEQFATKVEGMYFIRTSQIESRDYFD